MGPVSLAVLVAGLTALRWLLWITAGLMAVLVVVQALRGDVGAQPVLQSGIAAGLGALGWACGRLATHLSLRAR